MWYLYPSCRINDAGDSDLPAFKACHALSLSCPLHAKREFSKAIYFTHFRSQRAAQVGTFWLSAPPNVEIILIDTQCSSRAEKSARYCKRMDWYDPSAIDAEEDATDDATKAFLSWKQVNVFLIDARPAMFEESGIDIQGLDRKASWFSLAMQVVSAELKRTIISSPKNEVALVLYGTRELNNASNLDHVYVMQQLQQPTAQRIRECDTAASNGGGPFNQDIGSHGGPDNEAEDFRHGLWCAASMFTGQSSRCFKSVTILTNNRNPSGTPICRQHIVSRVKELGETGTVCSLVPMVSPSAEGAFGEEPFWRDVLAGQPDVDTLDTAKPSLSQSLGQTSRHKVFRKRPLRNITMSFGSQWAMGLQLYATLKTATKPPHIWVWAKDSSVIATEHADICQDTGEILGAADIPKRCFPKLAGSSGDGGGEDCRLPRVLMTTEELQDLKSIVDPGIHILGFKPVSRLADYHQLREPLFAYPSEATLEGSTTAFISIFNEMLVAGVMGVATMVANDKSPPKLMAVVAVEQVTYEDEDSGRVAQLEPPGFQLIQMPWADDIRHPEGDPQFAGRTHPGAPPDAVAAAESMMAAMQMDPLNTFSGAWPNPFLQRHYQVLEHLAMAEDIPVQSLMDDHTLPDARLLSDAAPAVQAFKDEVYGKGYSADIDARGVKRKAVGATEQDKAIDFRGRRAAGTLQQLTLPELKVYLRAVGLPLGGKKAEVVQRIETHLDTSA